MATKNQTIGTQKISISYQASAETSSSSSFFARFMHWCKDQQENRLLWIGIALAGHGCVLTPLTVLAVMLAGANFTLVILALVAMGMSLVTNLAAMPTKVTIPVFVFSVLLDIVIIIATLIIGYNIEGTYV